MDYLIGGIVIKNAFIGENSLINADLYSTREGRLKCFTIIMMFITEIPSPLKAYWEIFEAISMIVDIYDPYNYNKAIPRGVFQPTIDTSFNNIKTRGNDVSECFYKKNKAICTKLSVSDDDILALNELPTEAYTAVVESLRSYAFSKETSLNTEFFSCLKYDRDTIALCNIPTYRDNYNLYYDNNKAAYEANYQAELKKSIMELVENLTTTDPVAEAKQEKLKKIVNTASIILVPLVFITTYSVIKSLSRR